MGHNSNQCQCVSTKVDWWYLLFFSQWPAPLHKSPPNHCMSKVFPLDDQNFAIQLSWLTNVAMMFWRIFLPNVVARYARWPVTKSLKLICFDIAWFIAVSSIAYDIVSVWLSMHMLPSNPVPVAMFPIPIIFWLLHSMVLSMHCWVFHTIYYIESLHKTSKLHIFHSCTTGQTSCSIWRNLVLHLFQLLWQNTTNHLYLAMSWSYAEQACPVADRNRGKSHHRLSHLL